MRMVTFLKVISLGMRGEGMAAITFLREEFWSQNSIHFQLRYPSWCYPTGLFILESRGMAVGRDQGRYRTLMVVLMMVSGERTRNMETDNSTT